MFGLMSVLCHRENLGTLEKTGERYSPSPGVCSGLRLEPRLTHLSSPGREGRFWPPWERSKWENLPPTLTLSLCYMDSLSGTSGC